MESRNLWRVLALHVGAVLAYVSSHVWLAIALAVAAVLALVAALAPYADRVDGDERGLAVERLALVLVYACQHANATGAPASMAYLIDCRRAAIGLGREVEHG